MKKRSLLVSGITILVILLLWMKFQTTETFMLIFNPEQYYEQASTTQTNDYGVDIATEAAIRFDEAAEDVVDNVVDTTDFIEDVIEQEFEVESEEYEIEDPEETDTDSHFDVDLADALAKDITSYGLEDSRYYGYSHIKENLKPLYIAIYEILATRSDSTEIPTIVEEDINIAFRCVVQDHPELFYVDGYHYSIYKFQDQIDSITFRGQYSVEESEIIQSQEYIDTYVSQFMEQITPTMNTYEKVKAAYECVILNTEYDTTAINNQDIRSVFLYRKSVCQGYAEAFQYLLQSMDIPCTIVTGYAGGEPHAWTLVEIDGQYYYTDPTWGDGFEDFAKTGQLQEIDYYYMNMTSDEIDQTHAVDSVVSLPYATAMDANYYVYEGMYLGNLDTSEISRIFSDQRNAGRTSVTLKCANEYVYQDTVNHLFNDNHLFDYLPNKSGSIEYYTDDVKRVIIVYL